MSESSPVRVRIGNRADGGVIYWLAKLYAFTITVMILGLGLTGIAVYSHFASLSPEGHGPSVVGPWQGPGLLAKIGSTTPFVPDLSRYMSERSLTTTVVAADNTLLREFAAQWREPVALDAVPDYLANAFLAAEDHRFFQHAGIDVIGIARAVWRNIVAVDFAQGGSTITQQVAKQFLSTEKSLDRKAKEAIVARRLEREYSKEMILSVYLNEIFLGSNAYGVAAAAKRYFSKDLQDLTLAEAATLAGMAQAPSRYSPLRSIKRAKARRDEVLERMAKHGFASQADVRAAISSPVEVHPFSGEQRGRMPYYGEHARRYVMDRYGKEALMNHGLRVEITGEPVTEAYAYSTVQFGARKQDKRQGYRGAEAHLEGKAAELFVERSAALYSDGALVPGRRYLALVDKVTSRRANVRVGTNTYTIPFEFLDWATPWKRSPAINDEVLENARSALRPGDVVWVTPWAPRTEKFRDWFLKDGVNPRWRGPMSERQIEKLSKRHEGEVMLEQVSHPQSAIITMDHDSGYVVAMVGGADFGRSQFNRAFQACRQPGSTYKPIYYALAFTRGYGFDSALNDVPTTEVDETTGLEWTPENFGGTIDNKVTLEYALVFSKNISAVDIFKKLGAQRVERWARDLGFTTKIIADKALALGASCTLLHELMRAFSIFARNGRWIAPVFVKRVIDHRGSIIEDRSVYYDPMLSPADAVDRIAAVAGIADKQAIPARAGYLMSKLLRHTIQYGFASIIRSTGVNAAGKTGTSSATMDTSFVSYTSRWITAVWLGDDLRERPLGQKDAAYLTVVPMWARYMAAATEGHPNETIPWVVPEGVSKKDRGGKKDAEAGPMPLIYKKHKKPAAEEPPA